MVAIKCDTFGDIVEIGMARCKAVSTRVSDVELFKGYVNELYMEIATKKNWSWRKQDRSFTFDVAESSGSVSVIEDSRVVTFSTFQLDKTYLGRTLAVTGTSELYRIIGINTSGLTHQAYLCSKYVGSTNATANFKIYKYEFSIPPDCDNIEQVYIDSNYIGTTNNSGQIDGVTNTQFNRVLSSNPSNVATPRFWCKDGKIGFNDIPPLNEMILNYDFLGGEITDTVDRLRIYPIEPDFKRVIHMSYSLHVTPMTRLDAKPLIPIDNRWILVHGAAAEYLYFNDRLEDAVREEMKMKQLFKDMCSEYHVTDAKPRFFYDTTRNRKVHDLRRAGKQDLFYASRQREYS